ncbi:hypothetical protein [Endozoicomonas ascidiicola]|uniref:hypothetical protein n=1 Tax=Endozoicomonas ascidiicola TaxID=1698521 RepID=UPI00082E3C14|nr:hypothetical protein [Endozoicomonas ascidiicola]
MKIGNLFTLYVQAVLNQFFLPCSPAVVQLLVMIAAHESGGFRYVKQMGEGPAKGLLQMEPIGLQEVKRYHQLRAERFASLPDLEVITLDHLIFDTAIALICARVFFMAKPEPLPAEGDIEGLAKYAKKYWNTESGKASWEDYAEAYRRYC